jgi:hypothetical protein
VGFGAGGPVTAGLSGPGDPDEVVAVFQLAAGGLGQRPVVAGPGGAPVLADQGGHDVDVFRAVTHGDPPHRPRIASWGEPGLGQDVFGDLAPPLVGHRRVVGVDADGAVPDREAGRVASGPDRDVEQFGQVPEVSFPGRGGRGFEVGQVAGAVPCGDQVRVGVFLAFAGFPQVVQQPGVPGTRARGADPVGVVPTGQCLVRTSTPCLSRQPKRS